MATLPTKSWASVAATQCAQKPIAKTAQKPIAQTAQKPITVSAQKPTTQPPSESGKDKKITPPENKCYGCRLKISHGVTYPLDPWGMYDCLCDICKKCGANYYYYVFEGHVDGGPCDCGNTEYCT